MLETTVQKYYLSKSTFKWVGGGRQGFYKLEKMHLAANAPRNGNSASVGES